MKRIFFDFGFHHGEGLRKLHADEPGHFHDPSLTIIAFEPLAGGAGFIPPPPTNFVLIRAAVSERSYQARMSVNPGGNSEASTIEETNTNFERDGATFTDVDVWGVDQIVSQFVEPGMTVSAKIDIEGSEYVFFKPFVEALGDRLKKVWMEPHATNYHGPGGRALGDWPSWEALIRPATERGIEVVKWH